MLSVKRSSPHKNNALNDANENKFITKKYKFFFAYTGIWQKYF